MKKTLLILLALAFIAAPAFAGNRPEFDAVGDDSTNVFNGSAEGFVAGMSTLATHSNFTVDPFGVYVDDPLYPPGSGHYKFSPWEFFKNTAGQSRADTCMGGYTSMLTPTYTVSTYQWQIVLQMQPESDLNIAILDCVTKHNTFDITNAADQTGRYRNSDGELKWIKTANPSIAAKAYPGPYATSGFPTTGFYLDARQMPTLDLVALGSATAPTGKLYTSKGLWGESIVVAMPEMSAAYYQNQNAETLYDLKQGDRIWVQVTIPRTNPVDIMYGKDNVVLKYVGIIGTDFQTP